MHAGVTQQPPQPVGDISVGTLIRTDTALDPGAKGLEPDRHQDKANNLSIPIMDHESHGTIEIGIGLVG